MRGRTRELAVIWDCKKSIVMLGMGGTTTQRVITAVSEDSARQGVCPTGL